MRVVSIGDLVLDYYYKNGKLIGVDGGMSSHNIIANLAKKKISTAIYGVSGNDIQGKIANLSLKKLNVDVIDIIVALEAMKDPISMSEVIYNDGGDTIYLEDQLESKKNMASSWIDNISLKEAIHDLKEKEKRIITDRYLIGKTQMEIAEEIGISQAQVSRLEKDGLANIKKKML